MFNRAMVLLLPLLIMGCGGSDGGKTPGIPEGASEAIVQTRDMLLESSMMAMKLSKLDDVNNFDSKFPKAVAAVKDKSVVIVWGKTFKEGVTPEAAEIMAYEAKAADQGGWVVKNNGELYQMSASDFAAKVPKTSAKK